MALATVGRPACFLALDRQCCVAIQDVFEALDLRLVHIQVRVVLLSRHTNVRG